MTAIGIVPVAAADTIVISNSANSCTTCGWTPSPPTRGGPPVHIAPVLRDVVHGLGRCPQEMGDDAGRKRGRP
jgi:hypothetical protein